MKIVAELDKTIARFEKILVDLKELRSTFLLSETVKGLEFDAPRPNYGTKVEAMRQVLLEAGETLYIDSIVKGVLKKYGTQFDRKQASGIVRRYARDGRIFKAEGGNRFSLIDWSVTK